MRELRRVIPCLCALTISTYEGSASGQATTTYLNGAAICTRTLGYSGQDGSLKPAGTLYIGASPIGAASFGPGRIDDVRSYSTALSAAQISSLANP